MRNFTSLIALGIACLVGCADANNESIVDPRLEDIDVVPAKNVGSKEPFEEFETEGQKFSFFLMEDNNGSKSVLISSGPAEGFNGNETGINLLDTIPDRGNMTTLEVFRALVPTRPVPQELVDLHPFELDRLDRSPDDFMRLSTARQALTQNEANARYQECSNFIIRDISPLRWSKLSAFRFGVSEANEFKTGFEGFVVTPDDNNNALRQWMPLPAGSARSIGTKNWVTLGVNNCFFTNFSTCRREVTPDSVQRVRVYAAYKDQPHFLQTEQVIASNSWGRQDWGPTDRPKRIIFWVNDNVSRCHDFYIQAGMLK